jgi:DNA-directed RNA polymerase specialized sigma24 family protein
MNQHESKWRVPGIAVPAEKVLETYYGQLLKWGAILTRGDVAMAQDIVHDFCLHFTLTKPDLTGIASLDNYLYACLRHVYLSTLSRSSRDALSLVSTAEFDSIKTALTPNRSGDLLQKQNDLRRICCYSVWRKEYTKNASYFILRFFHGYHYQEIADLGRLPISAIYNNLKIARSEIRLYLQEPGKLQFANRTLPPVPILSWSPLSSAVLFKELRETILAARTGNCLPEERLLAHYRMERPQSISCSLLSHIVSCERCLDVVNQHFRRPTLESREPLDGAGGNKDGGAPGEMVMSLEAMLRSVRKDRDDTRDHRPRTLSIAVDGKILASHDVWAQRNTLSARIDHPDQVSFIEVFSEQGIRLALMPVDAMPPEGPHENTQRVHLNDGRWLEFTLTFDGLGLNSEVTYFDPALMAEGIEEDAADAFVRVLMDSPTGNVLSWPGASPLLAAVRRFLRPVVSSPVIAWSLVLACVFCVAGYFVFRDTKPVPTLNARKVLNQSIQVEATSLEGQTEHQVLRFEEASADGNILKQGTIDLWRDGDGKRQMRRLYDAQHRLIAAEWTQRNGERGQYPQTEDAQPSSADRELLADNLWKQDLSPNAFHELNGDNAQIRSTEDGYELTTTEPGASHPQLVSATLVLDRHFHPIREVMRVRSGADVHEVRFVQADYERRPTSSVPDAIFDPQDQGLQSKLVRHPAIPRGIASDVQLAELHIAVLYQLNSLNADASEPIEVVQTLDGHVRISGMVEDDQRKQEILSSLKQLDNHQLLQAQLVSPSDAQADGVKNPQIVAGTISAYEVGQTKAPADAAVRGYFQTKGLSGDPLDAAVLGYCREALGHAQRALQNASALSRLGSTFPAAELRSVSFSSQQQWTDMVAKHAAALEVELRALHEQLAPFSPAPDQFPNVNDVDAVIENPAQFARATNQLLLSTQSLNRNVGSIFAPSQSVDAQAADIASLVAATGNAIPLQKAVEVTGFAVQLNAAARTAQMNRQHSRDDKQPPNRP